jgi:hypothetical protein
MTPTRCLVFEAPTPEAADRQPRIVTESSTTIRTSSRVIQTEKKGSATMRKARKVVFGVLTLLLATGALAVPAGSANAASDGSGSRSAVEAKKKCKKGFVRKKQRCVKARKKCKKGFVRKKQRCVKERPTAPTGPGPTAPTGPGPTAPTGPGPTAPAWDEGRWRGHYAENGVELLFNVLGGKLYTGGFDAFFIHAVCSDGSFDPSAIAPVQATIASNGDFTGSGVYSPGFGQQIPWQLSGHISGKSITGGTFAAGPYADFSGDSCGGTTHFTGQWIAAYTL